MLEEEIVPRYYERDENGLPRRWLELMKASMATTIWQFSTSRMLQRVRGRAVSAGQPRAHAPPRERRRAVAGSATRSRT